MPFEIFLLLISPYLCFFGIVIPALVTAITFWLVAVWIDLSKKKISKDRIKIVLVMVFLFAAIVSWGSIIYYFRHYPIMLD